MQTPLDQIDSLINFSAVAGFYSQLSGVLAGFVFTSLIVLISTQIASTRTNVNLTLRSYRPLIAAFLGLVATSLNYAILGGEESRTGRITQLQVTAGLGFCVAGTMALYSILILLRGVEHDLSHNGTRVGHTSDLLRGTITFGICPLLIILMWGAQRDHLAIKYGPSGYHGVDLAYLISLLVILTVACSAPKILYRRTTSSGRLVEVISRTAVIISIVSLFASTLTISYMRKESFLPDYALMACLFVLTAFILAIMWSSATYNPSKSSPNKTDIVVVTPPASNTILTTKPNTPSPRTEITHNGLLITAIAFLFGLIVAALRRR